MKVASFRPVVTNVDFDFDFLQRKFKSVLTRHERGLFSSRRH